MRYEAAGKFLLLVEAAFHFATFGDVHDRALKAHYAAAIVANGSSRVQTDNGGAILANQGDLTALNHGLAFDLFDDALAFGLVYEDFGNPPFKQFFLGIVTQHADQRGIDLQNDSVGGGNVDAFLERLEEFSETGFVFAESGDVAGQDGNAVDLVIAHHGVRHAIEVEDCGLVFHTDLDNARPGAAFHEARHSTFHQLCRVTAALLDKIG